MVFGAKIKPRVAETWNILCGRMLKLVQGANAVYN